MDKDILSRFRQALTMRRDNLLEWFSMSTLQRRAYPAGAAVKGGLQIISKIKDALAHIEFADYGTCTECGGEIESGLLEFDFTTQVCLEHYTTAQIRDLERDLELASKVQQHLMASVVPRLSGLQIAAHTEPFGLVGGDYYDFFSNPGGGQGLAIADVMGKGLPAGMLASSLQTSLRILGPEHEELDRLAVRLNELFRYNLKLIRFISIFLAVIDEEAATLQYCNVGHNPPIWWQAATESIHWLKPTGPAIGLMHDPEFKSETLQLSPGDLLLLYTDGLEEARNPAGVEFGEERLTAYVKDHLNESANNFLTGLLATAGSFAGKFHDDVTLLVIKVL